MKHTRIALVVLVVLLLAAIVDMAYYYPILPQRMALHFDWRGNVDGWSNKPALFGVFAALTFGIGGLLALIGLVIRWIPQRLIHMPNKDYWLAPQRRNETWASVTTYLLWLTNATMLPLVGCMHNVFRANLQAQPSMPSSSGASLSLAL